MIYGLVIFDEKKSGREGQMDMVLIFDKKEMRNRLKMNKIELRSIKDLIKE